MQEMKLNINQQQADLLLQFINSKWDYFLWFYDSATNIGTKSVEAEQFVNLVNLKNQITGKTKTPEQYLQEYRYEMEMQARYGPKDYDYARGC
jgi:hypothetical protein